MGNVSELGYDYHAHTPVEHQHQYEHHEQRDIIADVPHIPASAPVYHPAPVPVSHPAPAHHYAPATVHYHESAPAAVHGLASAHVSPQNTYNSPAEGGYRYKTVRRIVYRRRF